MSQKVYCPVCNQQVDYIASIESMTMKVKESTYTLDVRVPHCLICGEELFVPDIDQETQKAFFDAYRKDHQLPTVEDMISTRKKLNLNQRDFSRLLGLGEISISRYELGSFPTAKSVALIPSILDPKVLEKQLNMHKKLISDEGVQNIHKYLERFGSQMLTGKTKYNEEKFHQLAYYFVNKAYRDSTKIYATKLNKLMFFTDFNFFNKFGHAITGSKYIKMSYGPVPSYYEFKYEKNPYIYMIQNEEFNSILPKEIDIKNQLTIEETSVADAIYSYFSKHNSNMISDMSHDEDAWKETENWKEISYIFAKDLKIQV